MDVLVIGAGVAGLTCAVRLQEAGFPTRIVARELPADTVSAVAAAVWYPYRAYPEDRVLAWGRRTLDVLYDLAGDPATGVYPRPVLEFFDHARPDPWWRPAVRRFRRTAPEELPEGYVDGYVLEAPVVETPVYLRYLLDRFERGGGAIEVREVTDLDALRAPGRLVVHCTGLGARALVGDEAVHPIRGQVVRVENPGLTACLIEEHGPLAMTYVIPRRHDCILGGTADERAWDRTPDPATTETILRRCGILEPRLAEARVLEVKVGLRPGRTAVRLEVHTAGAGPVVHNYGHGGAGFTLAWGCADEVLAHARALSREGQGAGDP